MSIAHLETRSIAKEYPGTIALQDVTVRFEGGKVHALLGKNGAGKSTLVKIFAGAVQPTSGEIVVNGTSVELHSPREALRRGIAAVHQELSLVPELTVAENILLGRLPHRSGAMRSLVDWNATFAMATRVLETLEVTLDVRQKASRLGVAQQQIVEIAKAMSYDPAVLMLDEPTSALAQHETDRLFELLRTLAARGVVLLYITHRLHEIYRIADTVTVLRNGRLVGSIVINEATPETVATMMFGQVVRAQRPAGYVPSTENILEVRNLSRGSAFQDVTFSLRTGEILGIAGLLGAGRTELLRALFGADPPEVGEVVIRGVRIHPKNPGQMKKLGVALTPENRKEEGLIQILSTRSNMCVASLGTISRCGFTTRKRERRVVDPLIQSVGIAVPEVEAPVSTLSGGNQQKVVVGKWLMVAPAVMLLDEPTRGIDVQAKQQVFDLLWELSSRGIGCIIVSSELEELLDVCHRILVMREGRLVAEKLSDAVTLEQLFALCVG